MAINWKRILIRWRKYLILFLTPIILSPLPIVVQDKRSRCAYVILIMAIYWTSEACSLAVTGLLPLLLFPLLGVVSAKEICQPYFLDTTVLFISGMFLACAVEQWNLHRRIALKILLLIGTRPSRLLLGFMCSTAFLSMWVSNTATTAMMVPIAQAVLGEMKVINKSDVKRDRNDDESPIREDSDGSQKNKERLEMEILYEKRQDTTKVLTVENQRDPLEEKGTRDYGRLCKATVLSIAYGANVGGTATLTGTGTNLVLVGQAEELFKESGGIGFGDWFIFAFPEALILLFLCWFWLRWMFLGIRFRNLAGCFHRCTRRSRKGSKSHESMKKIVQRQYDALGPMTFAEKAVLVHFVILALLWIFHDPKFVPGWSTIFKKSFVGASTAGMVVAFSLFNFPAKKPNLFDFNEDDEGDEDRQFLTLLDWKVMMKRFPWDVVFLIGGGFAIAKAAKDSGLSEWLGHQLSSLESIPQFFIILILCFVLCSFTEVTSNVATASIFIPIMAALTVNIHIHPWYLMVPATLSCSFAYMLPVATPPNAIIFSSGYLKVSDMVKAGLMMNVIAITVLLIWIHTFGHWWFNLGEFPSWAVELNRQANATNVTRC